MTKKKASATGAKKTGARKTAKPISKPVAKTVAKTSAPRKAAVKSAVPRPSALKPEVKKAGAPAKASSSKKTTVRAAVADDRLTPRQKAINKIRERLIAQKEALLAEADAAMNILPEPSVFPDLGDQASLETDRNFMLRLKGREQRLLKKIDEALDRMESETYGICEACGEDISTKRLEARPVTVMCIDCKLEQEEEEKLQGS